MKTLFIAVLLAVLVPTVVVASQQQDKKDKNEPMEVITVIGQKPLLYFKRQMIAQEKAFYKIFNSLISDSKFHIRCHRDPSVEGVMQKGSNIKKKYCAPKFVVKREPGEYDSALLSPTRLEINKSGNERYKKRVAKEQVELMKEVEQLLETNSTLREQLVKYAEAKDLYETKRAEKFDTDN